MKINLIGKRYYFFGLSLLIILSGMVLLSIMVINHTLPLAIDFTGGSLLEVQFADKSPQPSEIIALYTGLGVEDVKVQTTSEGSYVIRSTVLEDDVRSRVVQALKDQFQTDITVLRFESVGPTIGKEVTSRAAQAAAGPR